METLNQIIPTLLWILAFGLAAFVLVLYKDAKKNNAWKKMTDAEKVKQSLKKDFREGNWF